MKRQLRQRLGWLVVITCVLVTAWALATRRRPADVGAPGERVARVYDVGDLVDVPVFEPVPRDYFWELPTQPPTSTFEPASMLGPRPSPPSGSRGAGPQAPREKRMGELVALIQSSVDPRSWKAVGMSAVGLGRRLIVVQTRQNQGVIASIIRDLRAAPPRQLSAEAVWARLPPAALERCVMSLAGAVRAVDLTRIEQVPGAIAYRGSSWTVSGEWVRVRCGRARLVVNDVQINVGTAAAGLAPNTTELLDGAAVDLRASLEPDGSHALLDVRSEVTRWLPPDGPPIEVPAPVVTDSPPGRPMKIEPMNLGVQAITASLRTPTGIAILVGGTTEHDRGSGDGQQLYLIIRLSVAAGY